MRPVQPDLHRAPEPSPAFIDSPSSAQPIRGLSAKGQAFLSRAPKSISIGPRNDPARVSKLTKASI